MPRRDTRVTEYIQGSAPFARPILRHLRRVIAGADPRVEEDIRWGMPTYLHGGRILCGIGAFKAHCALWFKQGGTIVGPKPSAAMGQFGRIASLEDLPADAKIAAYVRKAIEAVENATGTGHAPSARASRSPRRRAPPRVRPAR